VPEYNVPFDIFGMRNDLNICALSPGILLAITDKLKSSLAVACFLRNSVTPPGVERSIMAAVEDREDTAEVVVVVVVEPAAAA